jgi:UDP-N-acetyl-D-mannosaminuronate dehydrogenase
MECNSVSDKIRHSIRKLHSDLYGAIFEYKAFIIPSTTRWNVNMIENTGRSVNLNLENYIIMYMVPCLIARHS